MTLDKWKIDAIRRLNEKESSPRTFYLKDLFSGDEWQKIEVSDRKKLGRFIAENVRERKIANVEISPVSKPGQSTRYIKH